MTGLRKEKFPSERSSTGSQPGPIVAARSGSSVGLRRRHFVYILECADGSLYTGYTTDPARRTEEHGRGRGGRYTRSRLPLELVYVEEKRTLKEALSRERFVKSLKKKEKLLLCLQYRNREGQS